MTSYLFLFILSSIIVRHNSFLVFALLAFLSLAFFNYFQNFGQSISRISDFANMHSTIRSLIISALFQISPIAARALPRSSNILPRAGISVQTVNAFTTDAKPENLAIRSNGQILVTSTANPLLYQYDPASIIAPALVTVFPDTTSALGITELQPDLFYITTGNASATGGQGTRNSFFVYEVDMTNFASSVNGSVTSPPAVRQVGGIPTAGLTNGVTGVYSATEQPANFLLIADTVNELIWKMDVSTGNVTVASDDQTMQGADGVKVQNETLYYSSSTHKSVFSIPIDTTTGIVPPFAEATVLANNMTVDDFILDAQGKIYAAGNGANVIWLIDPAANTTSVFAGTLGANSSSIIGPSALQFGRLPSDSNSLYVTAGGYIGTTPKNPGILVSGKQGIFRLDVGDSATDVIH